MSEREKAAIENLTKYQRQCDEDGVSVEVSREALDVVLAVARRADDAGRLKAYRGMPCRFEDNFCKEHDSPMADAICKFVESDPLPAAPVAPSDDAVRTMQKIVGYKASEGHLMMAVAASFLARQAPAAPSAEPKCANPNHPCRHCCPDKCNPHAPPKEAA